MRCGTGTATWSPTNLKGKARAGRAQYRSGWGRVERRLPSWSRISTSTARERSRAHKPRNEAGKSLAGRAILGRGRALRCKVTSAATVRADAPGSERDRAGNSREAGNQRNGEFFPRMSGSERDPGGSIPTPNELSRNGESRGTSGLDANPAKKAGKRETPRGTPLGVGW